MQASDLMTSSPATIRPEATIRQAVALLQDLDVRHLPVVDVEGRLVGMLSDRDLRALAIPFISGGESQGTLMTALGSPVSAVMSADVLSVDPEAEVDDIVELMLDSKIGAVPVVDRDRGLVGIVSYVDVLREASFEEG
jgi:acetoin utilization protein AcuB